ncbi:hypothetical protein HPB50_019236 [Hyalomma asiaticum]|uniref:Uncharacterized protein n=1 Tax=Hyalomma asiaticum TaxID=266040 RepID=A0ACB7S1I5_HYAAI|nr:hypothetical protein HPB50_019236 [Hyalomma asiaticum]
MADGARQAADQPPVAMQPTCPSFPEAPGRTNVHSATLFVRSGRGFVAGAISVSLVVVATVAVVVYMHQRQRSSWKPAEIAFCCPDEAREISMYVNKSVSPCNDFFAYVCSGTIRDSVSVEAGVRQQLQAAIVTGVMPAGVAMQDAGRFLNAYYKTCVHAILHHQSFASSLASALLRLTHGLLRKAGSRDAMTFSATMSLRYSLSSVMRVTHQRAHRLHLAESVICRTDKHVLDDLTTVAWVLSNKTDLAETSWRTFAMATELCDKVPARASTKTYDDPTRSGTFSREVWDVADIVAAGDALGFAWGELEEIEVRGTGTVRRLYKLFNNGSDRNSKGAYLLWHAVVSGMREFDIDTGAISARLFEVCTGSITKLSGLWRLFQAELLTSPEKDMQATNVFATIKKTAFDQLKSSPLVAPEDIDELKSVFENVSLLLPVFSNKASLATPAATPDFAENMLMGRAYDLDLRQARLSILSGKQLFSYRQVNIVDNRYIILLSNAYNFIRTGSTISKLPNMAVLGQLFAETLWLLAFNAINWKATTAANIENFSDCFAETYLEDGISDSDAERSFYSALGLSTVLRALNSTEWHKIKAAWSLWRLSEAQFFYILSSHHRCPKTLSTGARMQINVPLMCMDDFAKAYRCSNDSRMVKRDRCLNRTVSRT